MIQVLQLMYSSNEKDPENCTCYPFNSLAYLQHMLAYKNIIWHVILVKSKATFVTTEWIAVFIKGKDSSFFLWTANYFGYKAVNCPYLNSNPGLLPFLYPAFSILRTLITWVRFDGQIDGSCYIQNYYYNLTYSIKEFHLK